MTVRLSRDEAKRLGLEVPPKASKYGNRPTRYEGVRYDSQAEATRASVLDYLVWTGEVKFWIGQPTFRLGCAQNKYRPDFLVIMIDGLVHAEDVKGIETAKFRRDRKLWASYGPIPLWILTVNGIEIIHPEPRQ
jgi:hypothetical protein